MSGKSDGDPAWALVLIGILFIAVGWIIWDMFRLELLEAIRWLRLLELGLFGLFDQHVASCAKWLYAAQLENGGLTNEGFATAKACFGSQITVLPAAQAKAYYTVTPISIGYVTDLIAPYMRWLVAVFCAGMMLYATLFSIQNKYRNRYTLETFIQQQAKVWPIISPIVKLVPSKSSSRIMGEAVPDKLPLFAEALSPEEWISYHRIPVDNNIPDREATRRALLLQLGPRWTGLDGVPDYMLALFVAFALKGVQKREESDEILGRIATHWSPEKGFVLSGDLLVDVRRLAADPAVGGKALEIANNYAYRTTALLGVLKWARFMGGVLAPAHFVWLRAVDRTLWYPLNNLGRRSFHAEGAGAMAHFMAENAARKPLPIPRLETAIITLNQYFGKFTVKIPPREEPNVVSGNKSKA